MGWEREIYFLTLELAILPAPTFLLAREQWGIPSRPSWGNRCTEQEPQQLPALKLVMYSRKPRLFTLLPEQPLPGHLLESWGPLREHQALALSPIPLGLRGVCLFIQSR